MMSTSTKKMTVASWQKIGAIDLITKDVPIVKPGEILVKVAASGICGTDLHISRGETPHASKKVVIGHEFSGYVEEIHPETRTPIQVGDLVAVDPNIPCQQCTFCRNDKYHLCIDLFCIGVTIDGGMSRYVSIPARAAITIPKHISPEVAALAEPLSCVVHGVDQGKIKTGDQVLVIGSGPIGLMTIALASLHGGHVTVIEPNEMRRQEALSFGASDVYAPGHLPAVDGAAGEGYDVVFECVGRPNTCEDAVNYAKAGGTIVWIGVNKVEDRVPISPFDIYRKELTITSTYTNPFGIDRAVKILGSGKVDWNRLISHTFKISEFDEAWQVFLKGTGLKIIIKPE
ncbi:chaperonin 10-like protein [Cokeromyces recurvatus]|uniref:chaperonin 10-like protein n=1 Tax=Cokeromyces recurvatus TaxID=90255 RepID=UPI0022205567|nr:chaperonin 10-like protein [Cokeromyces recurvatus]KAI7900325.1 chaperonin 10-like protein [Cokeromyces recurvatus]